MRIKKWLLGAAAALLVVALGLTAIALVRWNAAGEAHAINPPPGAVPPDFEADGYERTVADRASIIARSLRNDRGPATVRIYAVPPDSPWLQSRKIVATQLDHWEQLGDCTDNPEARILECAWREPTRWWPRTVQLTMLRLPPTTETGATRRDRTFVIIGAGRGA